MRTKRGYVRHFLKSSEGGSLVETIVALALIGVISVPATGFFRLQQRYLSDAGEGFFRELKALTFFETLNNELALVQYPWWGPFPEVEAGPGLIKVSWHQGDVPRHLVLEKSRGSWILTVDGRRRGRVNREDLEFRPLLWEDMFRGFQALRGGEIFHFYTSSQPFNRTMAKNQPTPEVPL